MNINVDLSLHFFQWIECTGFSFSEKEKEMLESLCTDNLENYSNERSPKLMELPQKPGKVFMASIWGMSFPWTLAVSTVLGIGLMFAPATFGLDTQATPSDIFHLAGALIIVVSVISMGEVVRLGRYLNILLGLTVAVAPWFVEGSPMGLNISGAITGLIIAGLAIPRGPKTENYGLWDKYVK